MGRGRNRASIELYEAQAQARDKALPGRKKCPLWHGGGKSASLEKAHWEWAKGIAPVDCVDKGEGGCSHVWEDPKRPLSSVNGRAATSSPRRRRESVSCLLYFLEPLFIVSPLCPLQHLHLKAACHRGTQPTSVCFTVSIFKSWDQLSLQSRLPPFFVF